MKRQPPNVIIGASKSKMYVLPFALTFSNISLVPTKVLLSNSVNISMSLYTSIFKLFIQHIG